MDLQCGQTGPCKPDQSGRFGDDLRFANLRVGASNVLINSPTLLTVALLNIYPITPGHSIVVPIRQVERLADLADEELIDFWRTALVAQSMLQKHYHATAFNFAVVDGSAANQPVPHLHVHVVPRVVGDALGEDRVHEAINQWSPVPRSREVSEFDGPSDEDRKPRDTDAMASEAARYRLEGQPIVEGTHKFAKFDIAASSLFYHSSSGLTVAFVNLKPLVNGHVLVTPRRVVPVLAELTEEELADLFRTVREVQAIVCKVHGADAAHIGIQDGKDAGQSVPHVHVHILPDVAR